MTNPTSTAIFKSLIALKTRNPIVFASAYAPEVAAGRRLIGCRKLAEQYPQETAYHEATHDRFTSDMDTPEDYQRVLERLGLRQQEAA